MRKEVLEREFLDSQEPRLGGGFGRGQHISCMVSENIVSSIESGDHTKYGEHPEVEKCFRWEATSKEPDHRVGSRPMQFE